MAAKYFCDVCGTEVTQHGRVMRKLGDVMVEVMVRYQNTWNAGHVCAACVVKVVSEGEPADRNESYAAHTTAEQEKQGRSWLTALPQN